jgi:hypothetical protein
MTPSRSSSCLCSRSFCRLASKSRRTLWASHVPRPAALSRVIRPFCSQTIRRASSTRHSRWSTSPTIKVAYFRNLHPCIEQRFPVHKLWKTVARRRAKAQAQAPGRRLPRNRDNESSDCSYRDHHHSNRRHRPRGGLIHSDFLTLIGVICSAKEPLEDSFFGLGSRAARPLPFHPAGALLWRPTIDQIDDMMERSVRADCDSSPPFERPSCFRR